MKAVIITIAGLGLAAALGGCQTISEDSCLAGNWEDVGFRDGEKGRSRSRLANIAETCQKYSVAPDRTAYIRGLEMGLTRYCGSDNGFNAGRDGQSPNAECEAGGFDRYLDAYADGYEVYELRRERDTLVDRWQDRRKAFRNVTERLDATGPDAVELSAKERRRLERKAARLSREMENLRVDIRVFERLNGLREWRPDH